MVGLSTAVTAVGCSSSGPEVKPQLGCLFECDRESGDNVAVGELKNSSALSTHPVAFGRSCGFCNWGCLEGVLAGVLLLTMACSCFKKFISVLVASAAGVFR